MSDHGNFKDFFEESRHLVRDWADTKIEIYKLKLVRASSKIAGNLVWFMIMMFMISLFIIFAGVTAGYWLSEITGRYVYGFGLVTLFLLFLLILLVALRKTLFINPVIRKMIQQVTKEKSEDE